MENLPKTKPVALIVLDGWGIDPKSLQNAIQEANTPFFDSLWQNYPHALLNASEEHVGLPENTVGNSEIGHMTMGAGRVIYTDLVRINKAIKEGEYQNNQAFIKLFEHVKKHGSTLHVLGLVSPAGVHSHQEHLHEFLRAAKSAGIRKVCVHAFTDGRDSPPEESIQYLQELENILEEVGIGKIATASGRYFAMDRDKNWDRIKLAEDALFESKGETFSIQKISEFFKQKYLAGESDEYIKPVVFLDENGNSFPITQNDGVFFFNFRTDRPRQLSYKIMERAKSQNLFFVTMTEYEPGIESLVAFPPQKLETTLAGEISKAGLRQSHIAETEKYGHVTFFFNGGKQTPHENERHFLIDSRKDVSTHDQAPEMKAKEITDRAIKCLNEGDDFLVINYANADIVGHTANKPAVVQAVEILDRELRKLVGEILSLGGTAIVTADHGNAEVNIDQATGAKHTSHTTNPVPFILVSRRQKPLKETAGLNLSSIAPTVLKLLNLTIPSQMTGKPLV